MLSDDKHCELLSAGIRDRMLSIQSDFKSFVQLFSALVGGAVALRLQYKAHPTFACAADALALLITFTYCLLIFDAFRAWHGYRVRLSEVAGQDIIPPPHMTSMITVIVMIVVIVFAFVGFVFFNPFRISN